MNIVITDPVKPIVSSRFRILNEYFGIQPNKLQWIKRNVDIIPGISIIITRTSIRLKSASWRFRRYRSNKGNW